MRRLLVLAAAVLTVAGCSADGANPGDAPTGSFSVTSVRVGNRDVQCVVWSGYKQGGMDCDWAGATLWAGGRDG